MSETKNAPAKAKKVNDSPIKNVITDATFLNGESVKDKVKAAKAEGKKIDDRRLSFWRGVKGITPKAAPIAWEMCFPNVAEPKDLKEKDVRINLAQFKMLDINGDLTYATTDKDDCLTFKTKRYESRWTSTYDVILVFLTLNYLREKEEVAKAVAEAEGTKAEEVTLEAITTAEVETLVVAAAEAAADVKE